MRLLSLVAGAASLCLAHTAAAHAQLAPSKWEEAFPIAAAPERMYFRAHYLDGRSDPHELQVWRDGTRRLRRQTDATVDLYVMTDNAGNLDYRLADRIRGVIVHTDQTSLYRVGRFSGWLGLAHMLDVPIGSYRVTVLPEPAQSMPSGQCNWLRLDIDDPKTSNDICWSRPWGIPFVIAPRSDGTRVTQFSIRDVRVLQADDDDAFAVDTKGLIQIDARTGTAPSD